MTKVGLIGPHS